MWLKMLTNAMISFIKFIYKHPFRTKNNIFLFEIYQGYILILFTSIIVQEFRSDINLEIIEWSTFFRTEATLHWNYFYKTFIEMINILYTKSVPIIKTSDVNPVFYIAGMSKLVHKDNNVSHEILSFI